MFLIFQQELVEASDIALNLYNETHPLEQTSQGVSKATSTSVNLKRVMLFSSFTKQLVIADINLTHVFLEEVKHHCGSFSCLRCYKRNFIVLLSIMWMQKSKSKGSSFGMAIDLTKMHCISRNRPSLIVHLMIGYQQLHIGHS